MSFQEAINLIDGSDFQAARDILNKLLEDTRSDAAVKEDVTLNLAVCYAAEHQLDRAVGLMQELPAHRSNYDLRFNIALCKYQMCKDENVFEFFKELTQLLDDIIAAGGQVNEVASKVVAELCNLLWHFKLYQTLETVLLKARPLFPDKRTWTRSLAHTLFMMDHRYEECCELYSELLPDLPEGNDNDNDEEIVADSGILSADPFVLANLCVSLVLTGRNTEAEELIKEVETDESNIGKENMQVSHLDTINLAIGTLYCVKNNQEFGLIRVFKTFELFEELHRKDCSMKWFHAKRCILALIDMHCKQMVFVKDDTFDMIITFLKQCECHGVSVTIDVSGNLAIEARYLRAIIVRMLHDS